MKFREDAYVIDRGKTVVDVFGQLHIEGGVLAVIAPNGHLVHAYGVGAWVGVWLKAAE